MHDFGKIVYLDLHKTGSTLVSRFLNDTCVLPLVREEKHERVWGRPKRKTFYFITVRHPVSQYSSLFRYGLDGRGGLFERLASQGFGMLYNRRHGAFNHWLKFVLDWRNSCYLGEGFERVPQNYELGFLSYRYLMLALPRSEKSIFKKPGNMDILEYARRLSFVDHVLKNEELNEGLKRLALEVRPEFFDEWKVRKFFQEDLRTNVAMTDADSIGEVDDDIRNLISVKERVLMSFYE